MFYFYVYSETSHESVYKRDEDKENGNMEILKEKVKELIKHIEEGENYESDLSSLKPLLT